MSRHPSAEQSLEQLLDTLGLTSAPRAHIPVAASAESSPAPVSSASPALPPARFFTNFADFSEWVKNTVQQTGCSDIYLSPEGVRLLVRRTLCSPPHPILWDSRAAGQVWEWIAGSLREYPAAQERLNRLLRRNGSVDVSWNIAGLRFRVNIFHSRQQMAFVLRHIPPGIRHFSSLGLPPAAFTYLLEHLHQGWLIIAGPCGSGKTTTLSACIEFWNRHRQQHILTIEDPIEYFHQSHQSLIHQCEIGTDAISFPQALRSALRQSPQIIVIGEIRDEETARLALQAAETGHLVATTIHAPHAIGALRRLSGFFPPSEQPRVWERLVETFSAVVVQVLLPELSPTIRDSPPPIFSSGHDNVPPRLPAIEILRSSFHIRQLLSSPHCTHELLSEAMERSRDEGMIAMDDYLYMLVTMGRISLETALTVAHSPSNLRLRVTAGMEKY